ncbi:MAG: hypothetical protein ACYCOU_04245 [Sulfobacillus sp.]
MDWDAVNYQINDLPRTFKRTGTTYQWLSNSLTAALHRYTNSDDGVNAQATFTNAEGKWLDTWGLLFGIKRNPYEEDSVYQNRISQTIASSGSTPVEIQEYMSLVFGTLASVDESLFASNGSFLTTPEWSLKFGSSFPSTQYGTLAAALSIVRTAGIPFYFDVLSGGLVLGTVNYLGNYRMTGDYLTTPSTHVLPSIPSSTNNAAPLLPTLYLEDTTLNPSLPAPTAPVFVQPINQPQTWGSDAYTNFTTVTVDPNGTLAGNVNDKAFNTANRVLYFCVTQGTSTTAVWEPVNASIST